MRGMLRTAWILVPLWALLVGVALYARPLLPIDETRYVAVAWEMWRTGDYLVPHLNGEVYSHKPPLLFWLINAGWALFGVSEVVARAIAPLFGLLDLFLVALLAHALWPDDEATQGRVGAVLLAFPFFALYSTLLMFDAMLTAFVLIALIGLVHLARKTDRPGWRHAAALALGIGGGLLAKGPVVFLYVLPVLFTAPWWADEIRNQWRSFVARVCAGVAAGIGIAFLWAIPAAIRGGEEYREAIFWTQTAGRMAHSFAHERTIAFYVLALPLLLFPWLYWTPVLTLFRRAAWRDNGLQFSAAWVSGGFFLLCLVSGKQMHYLLPLMPGAALIVARTIGKQREIRRPVFMAACYALLGIATLLLEMIPVSFGDLTLSDSWPPMLGAAALVAGSLMFADRVPRARTVVWSAAAASTILLSTAHVLTSTELREAQDTVRIGRELAMLQAAGKPLIHRGQYHGQFTFAGRLTEPIPVAHSDRDLAHWCARHPDGFVIRYWQSGENRYVGETEITAPFRGRVVGLVHAHAQELKKELARRFHAAPVGLGP